MSLRDFNPADDRPNLLRTQPLGNGAGLGNFHTVNPDDAEPSNKPKIVGVLAVALMVGVAGVALYTRSPSPSHSQPIAAANNLSAPPAAPVKQAAIAPDANMPVAAPAPPPIAQAKKAAKAATADPNSLRAALVKTPAPMKTASTARSHVASGSGAASARMAADSNQSSQPSQQQAVTSQSVSPKSPPSAVAATDIQSGVAVPQAAATASDIPASPQAPAQDQQSAMPAPAQPPAQSAGQVNQ
jgi:hypothetical protein